MLTMIDDDTLYDALLARDARFEGRAWVAVRTTGIFCRLTCPARKPKRENVAFFDTVAGCLKAGFRPCQRCRPLASLAAHDPVVQRLLGVLDADPARRWTEADIAALGLDPSTVRRAFRRAFGTTFLEIARLARLRLGAAARGGGARVIDAQLEAGFESASGFRAAFARLVGRPPGALSGAERLQADWIDTPLGPMIAVADEAALWLLEFADRRALPGELRAVAQAAGSPIGLGRPAPTARVAGELQAYFEGRQALFETPTAPYGTAFSRRVWTALRAIPPGRTCAYADLAVAVGQPAAVRAVARANGANRLAILVPCHRVIAADGGLAGYGGGLWRKRWLIEHERRAFSDGQAPRKRETAS
jgi:AraC family transcriptional regulator of adaptative response/methylated-DNA-[protein]-cysteine methyltransferase